MAQSFEFKLYLIKQNEISSQQQLIYKFKQDVNSVLLGTGVFWEGISIEGIAIFELIIYKLPFPLPEPIINENVNANLRGSIGSRNDY